MSIAAVNTRNQFVAIPEVGINLGWHVTNCIDVSAILIQGCEAFFLDTGTAQTKKKKNYFDHNNNFLPKVNTPMATQTALRPVVA